MFHTVLNSVVCIASLFICFVVMIYQISLLGIYPHCPEIIL